MDYKVHIGYGFHVNCYHSYRGDTNDELGFGGDIRVIRKIIEILDSCNEQGIPVKGTWDFENAYSLEEILPKYAPDIIESVRERVMKYGDENDIMGYNNGALGAMTEDEFSASIEWAVTNPNGSGLLDLFGECARIVRPQEMMFTPSQIKSYKRMGIEALCLYYSCVPFDGFRTLIPQLPDEQAFNPVSYCYEGEKLTVIPTYSNTDVIDAGSLRYLAKELHQKQLSGEINNDVFIFVNMDADAILWEPLELPGPFSKLANTDGIRGLVMEVADLDFVVFDTPAGYLKNHPPLTDIEFTQDTADGSFTGYSSWAEKPFNRQIWTRLERARAFARAAKFDKESPSFFDRVMLLSTTHFGLASPVLNVEREKRALELSQGMMQKELAARPAVQKLTLANPNDATLVSAQLAFDSGALPEIGRLEVKAKGLAHFGAIEMDKHADGSIASAFVICRFKSKKAQYPVEIEVLEKAPRAQGTRTVQSENLRVNLCNHGEVVSVYYKEKQIGGKDFLRSYLTYDKAHSYFSAKHLEPLPAAGAVQGCRLAGEIHLPQEVKPGSYSIDLFTLPGVDCVFTQLRVAYPYTREESAISTHSSALGRFTDMKWQQSVPMQIRPALTGDLQIVKRNFAHELSAYRVASFWSSVTENTRLDSFNNQLTGGMVGLSNGETGLVIANARQVLGSMAHCPMRLAQKDGQAIVRMNPFGTYHGKQRRHPTRSNGAVGDSFVMVAPQARSIAPAYNGVCENSMMALFAYDGLLPEGETLSDICAFADGAVVLEPEKQEGVRAFTQDNVNFSQIVSNAVTPEKLKSVIASGIMPGPIEIGKIVVKAFGNIVKAQIKSK